MSTLTPGRHSRNGRICVSRLVGYVGKERALSLLWVEVEGVHGTVFSFVCPYLSVLRAKFAPSPWKPVVFELLERWGPLCCAWDRVHWAVRTPRCASAFALSQTVAPSWKLPAGVSWIRELAEFSSRPDSLPLTVEMRCTLAAPILQLGPVATRRRLLLGGVGNGPPSFVRVPIFFVRCVSQRSSIAPSQFGSAFVSGCFLAPQLRAILPGCVLSVYPYLLQPTTPEQATGSTSQELHWIRFGWE